MTEPGPISASLEAGAYQTLRHLLYCRALARKHGVRAELVYLVHGAAIGCMQAGPAEIEAYREDLFNPLFLPPYPRIVLWESLLAATPAEVLDEPLAEPELHRGATFRDYLAGRRRGGMPAPLASLPRITSEVDDPPLLLPDVCAYHYREGRWERQVREWPVVAPRAKLLEKYMYGASAIFGHCVGGRRRQDRRLCPEPYPHPRRADLVRLGPARTRSEWPLLFCELRGLVLRRPSRRARAPSGRSHVRRPPIPAAPAQITVPS